MTKLQEEVCAELFTAYKQRVQDFMNNDLTAAQALVERHIQELHMLFQAKSAVLSVSMKK